VVLNGTGKPAQLDGYSAAGKTGTAQKIDPKTHTYSKTKYVASFVGFAPVNDPAVTIAIVMDSPTKGSHFGNMVSAPVFHELAQQILEYLGVPHDQELTQTNLIAKDSAPVEEDAPQEETADLESLFAEANHLPADDPLSASAELSAQNPERSAEGSGETAGEETAPEDAADGQPRAGSGQPGAAAAANAGAAPAPAGPAAPAQAAPASLVPAAMSVPVVDGTVRVANERVAVPAFAGKSLRAVVVEASAAGLGVQVVGSGLARDQAPAAGTLVPAGTAVVVKFGP